MDVRIGKTVIETLTEGMYEDSKFIYREYIQNAADQIDKAIELGILKERKEGKVHINIDIGKEQIVIEDNATGIESEKVFKTLGNIALSEKDRTKNKGFRGIGRLGGLGYCDELVYETSYPGENTKTIMKWDAKKLRCLLHDKAITKDAGNVVKSVIDIETCPEDTEKHYLKVILNNVKNKTLLEINEIKEYLSMVAPIPYRSHFVFCTKIYDYARENDFRIDEYYIYLNNDQLYKPYKTFLYEKSDGNERKKYDEITDVSFFDIKNKDKILAWGWYGISRFEKQIPRISNYYRGIRLRKGNIQIGNEQVFIDHKISKDERDNAYFIGEIFCIHNDLIPNSRRDYFNENEILESFERALKTIYSEKLHNIYYKASAYKNAIKKINKVSEYQDEFEEKERTGFIGDEKETLTEKIESARRDAADSEKKIEKIKKEVDKSNIENNDTLKKVITLIEKEYKKENITPDTFDKIDVNAISKKQPRFVDQFSGLNKRERKLIDKILSIIKNTLPPSISEELIEKIKEEFK
ncbi:MAG: ATP-binding protein [Treponema sp.]|jgi:molecular chaperone HtpG|nr:ATP-binding protein [Treponema sp.]